MTHLSGWCSAPDGARPMCGGCRVLDCGCACLESLSTAGVSASADVTIGETKRAPDRVLGGPQSRALADWIGVDL